MPDRSKLDNFSHEELLEEARARHAGSRSVEKAAPTTPHSAALKEFTTAEIVNTLLDKQKSIYGVDDRQDLYEVTIPRVLVDADSVVSLFKDRDVTDNHDGTSTLSVRQLGTEYNLCKDEAFREQPVGAFCTGFLVAPDLIATAGHCARTDAAAKRTRFVFGYRMKDATTAQLQIANSEIYSGVALVGRQETDQGPDWALVKLDRPVPNHAPLTIRRDGKIAGNQPVHIIGHPVGLPAKYAAGAQVRDNSSAAYFVANLDSFGGNSGSPVFNAETHFVEGVLVRGDTDFVPHGQCSVALVCPTGGCRGEDCTRTTEFAHLVPSPK